MREEIKAGNERSIGTMIPMTSTRVQPWELSLILLYLVSALTPAAAQKPLKLEEDELRRIWNKKFVEARDQAAAQRPKPSPAKSQSGRNRAAQTAVPTVARGGSPDGPPLSGKIDGELIGITFWRLKEARGGEALPSLAVRRGDGQVSRLVAERVSSETRFQTGERVRIGVEIPRETRGYLYVLDREEYADGTRSAPYLIFPSQSTPLDGNRIAAGKIVDVPAQGDPAPHFTLQKSRPDQIRELLTIIVTPEPLALQPGPPDAPAQIDPDLVAHWETQWGGRTEKRELRGVVGANWTSREKAAGEGKRKLSQGDPLPQTIYLVSGKVAGYTLTTIPIQLAP